MTAAVEDVAYEAGVDFILMSECKGRHSSLSVAAHRSVLDEWLPRWCRNEPGCTPRSICCIGACLSAAAPEQSTPVAADHLSRGRTERRAMGPFSRPLPPGVEHGEVGAYRISAFGRSYIYRRIEDLETMSGRVGDARLVKYAAALDSGLPLTGYDPSPRSSIVPLGADLPGLYGRAAVLASGRPPVEDEKR